MEQQIKRGIEFGLKEICFTEHLDIDPIDYHPRLARPGDSRDGFLDEAYYEKKITGCQELYGSQIAIRKGVEIGEPHRFQEEAKLLLGKLEYDMVLASVHNLYNFAISAPWKEIPSSAITVYRDYFDQVYLLAQNCNFDVIGHLDIIKRYGVVHYGPFDPQPHQEQIREILRVLIHRGKGIEINTSGLRQKARETMPNLMILRWYRELGGEILTIGSDSHQPFHLGFGLDEAREIALTAGFKAFTTFKKRQPTFHDFVL